MKVYNILFILSCTPLTIHPMVSKLWNMKSFIAQVQPAKDILVETATSELERLTPLTMDQDNNQLALQKEVLTATKKILSASIPIIEQTGNFAQSKSLQELSDQLKELEAIITNCTSRPQTDIQRL